MNKLDILIPYHAQDNGDELRYTLRSIEKNVPHNRVVIVGGKHDWFSDKIIYIPKYQRPLKYVDAESNIRLGLLSDLSDEFLFFNDDMIITNKLTTLPNYHLGTLSDCLRQRKARIGVSGYNNAMRDTIGFLQLLGIKEPLNYSAHIPMKMKKRERLIVSHMVMERMKQSKPLLARTIYGNLFLKDGVKVEDVKIADKDREKVQLDGFLSTSEKSFNDGMVGLRIRQMFPEPSKYEK